MRLTLLYSPGVGNDYQDQATQDIGHHEMIYAVEGHAGDWRTGNTSWEAARLNQPLIAFTTPAHDGPLKKAFSLFHLSSDHVQVVSIKKAEKSDEIVIRVKELGGSPVPDIRVTSALSLVGAREINGQEKPLGPANLQNGALSFDLAPYQLRAFALKVGAASNSALAATSSQPVPVPYDLNAVSSLQNLGEGNFDGQGHAYPKEQFPATLVSGGVTFQFGSTANGADNALRCRGQSIDLPAGTFNRAYLLAASVEGDQEGDLQVDGVSTPWTVQDWSQFIGQWDNRQWNGKIPELTYDWRYSISGLIPGYIKRAPIAWYCSHRHDAKQGNEFYQYVYCFKYGVDLPAGAKKLTLPNNDKIRVFAVSVANEPGAGVSPAAPLYDTLSNHVSDESLQATPASGSFSDEVSVTITPPLYYQAGHLHYTTDGTVPKLNSPSYIEPLVLHADTQLKASEFDSKGQPGPILSANYSVDDVSPPTVASVLSSPGGTNVTVSFSKPVRPDSALMLNHYGLAADESSGQNSEVVAMLPNIKIVSPNCLKTEQS